MVATFGGQMTCPFLSILYAASECTRSKTSRVFALSLNFVPAPC